jgi:rubredoxin
MVSEIEVPDLIQAFLDRPRFSPATRKAYRYQIVGFLCWAEARGRTLETVSTADRIAYVEEIASRSSAHSAMVALTGVRGFYRHLAACGVLVDNPFESAGSLFRKGTDRAGTSSDSTPGKPEQEAAVSDDRRFPLLALMAMLANMEEKSLEVVFSDDITAGKLVEFVRWRDGRKCPMCGAVADDELDAVAPEGGGYRCRVCGCTYAVTDGTPFEGLSAPLRHALFLVSSFYLSDGPPPDPDALARDRGLEAADVMAVCFRVEEALAREGFMAGDELRQAVARKNRELTQDEVARDIIEYGELVAVRDYLFSAKATGSPVADLPPGMTLDEAIATIEAKIADHDRYVITVEDGYLVSQLAESAENPPEPGLAIAAEGQPGSPEEAGHA